MIDRSVTWFWNRVDVSAESPDRSLQIVRWLVGLYLLVIEAPHYAWIDDAPRAFFDPPVFSIAHLVGGFPPKPFFLLLDLVAIAAIVLMILGVRARMATVVVVVCRLIGTSFMFSFGKIDHTIMLTVFLAVMAYCDWGREPLRPGGGGSDVVSSATALRSQRARGLYAVVLAFGFLTAGLPKLLNWVDGDTSTSGFLSWYYEGVLDLRRDGMLAGLVPGIPAIVLELVDVAAVAVEMLGFLALLLGRRWWRSFLLLVSMLHLANVLVLNIEFTAQAMTYLAFADLTMSASERTAVSRRWKQVGVVAVASVVTWHVQARVRGNGSPIAFVSGYQNQIEFGLYFGALIGVAMVGVFVREVFREFSGARTPDEQPSRMSPA